MQSHDPNRLDESASWVLTSATKRVVASVGASVVLGLALPSCDRSVLSDGLSANQDCTACHGSNVNAAPPKALNGSTSTTEIGVGAHQRHLTAATIALPVACTECHRLPTDLLTHPDPSGRLAIVAFGAKASFHGAFPAWDRGSASCTGVYCHGALLSGAGDRPAPTWTKVDDQPLGCDSCHGFPPAGNHPNLPDCFSCHGDVVNPDATIKDPRLHIDGEVQFYVAAPDAGAAGAAVSGAGGSSP